jgi:hypothetical protein
MAKIGKWHIGGIAGAMIVIAAVALFAKEAAEPSVYGVCTVGFNYRDKPIYWFGVLTAEGKCGNDVGGTSPGELFSGGGGVACGCSVRPGEIATVKWEFDQPYDEVEKHVLSEKHETKVTIPKPESRTARYLQVHFLADNRVVLDWRDDIAFSRVEPATGKILELGDGWIDPETGKVAHEK